MNIGEEVRKLCNENSEELMKIFCYAHENPELSFQEYDTTNFIKDKLISWGIEILDIGLETGVVGLLKGNTDGPCIALRADIDGLPIKEESSCEFPSKRDGKMHACGHDVHYSSLLGGAMILSLLRDQLEGSVKFLFQPAEEINLGAKKMMELRCLENPKVDAIFGMHNSPEIPCGTVAVKNGPLMAAVDRINIKIKGKGGHGGIPQKNADPIVATASVIQAVQTIVSRNISPIDSAVVSICNIQAGTGTTNNVTPDEVNMYGTVRTYNKEVEHMIEKRLNSIIKTVAEAYGCTGELEYIYELAVTDNNSALYDIAKKAVEEAGALPVQPESSTGGEDFSAFLDSDVPGFFYWLGVRNEEEDCKYSWHSPHFKVDPRAIKIGSGVYAMTAFEGIQAFKNK